MLRVLIADDEKVIRQGLSVLVDWNALGFEVVALAENGVQANKMICEQRIDLVIADIRMPKMDGLALAEIISQRETPLDFIAVSGYRDFEYAQRMMMYGASAYLLKPINARQLEEALRKIAAQKGVLPPAEEQELIPMMRRMIENRCHEDLTLQDLGAELNYNPTYLGRMFKQETGQFFKDYLNLCRMNRAAKLLLENSSKVSQVAEQVGIRDVNYFARQFRATFEKTPVQYRNDHTDRWSEKE